MKLIVEKKTLLYIVFGGLFLIILGVILGFKVLPKVVEKKVWENVVLQENTEQWEMFKEMPFPFTFKVYFFHVENPQGILSGEKPVLSEKGPYIYDLFHWKTDISWEDEYISYYEWSNFIFNSKASGKLKDDDEVTVLNAPYNGLFINVEEISPNALEAVSGVTEGIFGDKDSLFVKVKVKDYLFNGFPVCEDPSKKGFLIDTVCKQMKARAGKGLRIDGNRLLAAQLHHKNMTHLGKFTINSGSKEKEKVATLTKHDDKLYLDTWRGGNKSDCNQIRGVVSFPAFIKKEMKFDTFSEDICRVMTLSFNKTERVKGIQGYKFTLMNNSMDSSKRNEGNFCYCINRTRTLNGEFGCLKDGVLDLTNCIGTQILLSFPHFLYADKEYQNSVEGLSPNADSHETFVTLEPTSGVPLKVAKRVQFNMFLRAIEDVPMIENLTNALLPLFWVEESLILPDKYTDKIKKELLNKLLILEIFKYTLIITGLAAVLIPGFLLIYLR
ncbi:sensory neuron membrane protein 2-like [Coccinella septempunctata]|uniref:sensory neuron membrane protein 2-like n=1 Tax=Coccinella septempunctata TaxID=41139 RepID=UPI001D07E25C|nr:sensory neuron membrane protein 2-like [Coccinella septempunctata]